MLYDKTTQLVRVKGQVKQIILTYFISFYSTNIIAFFNVSVEKFNHNLAMINFDTILKNYKSNLEKNKNSNNFINALFILSLIITTKKVLCYSNNTIDWNRVCRFLVVRTVGWLVVSFGQFKTKRNKISATYGTLLFLN